MENFALLFHGFQVVFTLQNIGACLLGAFLGLVVGAMPGIGSLAGVALLLPLTYKFNPTTAIVLLGALYYSNMYGGAFSAILLNIPGDSPAVMTALDGYPMATVRKRPGQALFTANLASCIGGTIGMLILAFLGPALADADLVVAEGFIEPHFFAGFSGSRKSILPGVASRTTVLANHCSEFIADPHSRTGILEGNPIHKDMVWAARKAKLAFILNVVIDSEKKPIFAVAGDMEKAHEVGCRFLSSLCRVKAQKADIVISTNGGYPLDQNIYQAVKGMTAAEATVNEGGVIIMLAKSNDGIGGDAFYHQMADEKDIYKTMALFMSRGRNETVPDQWQTQIFLRILMKAKVVYVSSAPDNIVEDLHMVPAHSLEEALSKAEEILGNKKASVTMIPDGVSVIVEE